MKFGFRSMLIFAMGRKGERHFADKLLSRISFTNHYDSDRSGGLRNTAQSIRHYLKILEVKD
jgi:hypothetical protein